MARRIYLIIAWLVASAAPALAAQDARPRVLVVNDDGYAAPGLRALVDSLLPHARVTVAAPLEQQSGTGHGITYRDAITLQDIPDASGIEWYAIGARPATVVRLALEALMDTMPDLVISGINAGENLGHSAWLSGTVAAAREAAILGIPAIAVSLQGNELDDYAAAARYVRRLVPQLRAAGLLEPGFLLNVNVPAGAGREAQRAKVVRLSPAPGNQRYERRVSPRGLVYFWDNWAPLEDDVEGTDVHAFVRGSITLTPLVIDQTDRSEMERLADVVSR